MTDKQEPTRIPLKGIRATAARRMTEAWAAPVFHLTAEVDTGSLAEQRAATPGATVTDLLVRATAAALLEVPEVNAHLEADTIVQYPTASVGIAAATPKGLMVPVIHDASELDLAGVVERRKDIVARARDGKLGFDDIVGGTFTISNLGMMGIVRFDAILNPPQVAILAVGSTNPRAVPADGGGVTWRQITELTLTCDHRALDGATGARFLQVLKRRIETGE